MESRATRAALGIWTVLVVLFLWIPLGIILVYAFNPSNIQSWPISGFTLRWFRVAWHDQEARDALLLSLKAASVATGVALVLGTMAAAAVSRFRFFGREALSFLFVLPLALPGVITGIALSSFYTFWGVTFSLWTIVIGHATFCVVIVYNNVLARLRRTSPSLVEASMDLGADGWQTFRFVTFPVLSTALVSGGSARVRALVRRGDRDVVHGRRPEHAPDLDPRQDPARPAASGGQRGRLRRHRADRHSGCHLAAAGPGVRPPATALIAVGLTADATGRIPG